MKVEITHKDKILFKKDKITKEEFVNYYKYIAKYILPLIKDSPISLMRFPDGPKGLKFYQKNVPDYFPKWIKTVTVKRKGQKPINMVICNDKDTLLYLANQVCVLHPWLSKKDKLDYPDRLIFDLDPGKASFDKVIESAKDLKKVLDKLKLTSFVMTTGSKGVHVIVSIKREKTFDEVRSFARDVAQYLAQSFPNKYTIETRKNKRRGRIFIDYLRNGFAQTSVAPYSIRSIENAPIATPIKWSELNNIDAQSFNIKNIKKRRSNPFSSIDKKAYSLEKAMKKIKELFTNDQ